MRDSGPVVSASDPAAFLGLFLRVLLHGGKTSTMKPLLALALLDFAIEVREDSPPAIEVPVFDLGRHALRILWHQVKEFQGHQLRHHNHRTLQIDVVREVGELRRVCLTDSLGSLLRTPAGRRGVEDAEIFVARKLAEHPIPRFQRFGLEELQFIWPVSPAWALLRKGRPAKMETFSRLDHCGLPVLETYPGAMRLLAALEPLLRPHVEGIFTGQVARLNPEVEPDVTSRLREHLFPSPERASLSRELKGVLHEVQGGRCLWCDGKLGPSAGHVDHVVPWTSYRNDNLENLVLADARCNESKAAWLPSPRLIVSRYLPHVEGIMPVLDKLAERARWQSDVHHSLQVLGSALSRLRTGAKQVWVPETAGKGGLIMVDGSDLAEALARIETIAVVR